MSVLPLRAAVARTAEERAERAAWLRRVLGPVEGWPEEERFLLRERIAIAEIDGCGERSSVEREFTEAFRDELLRRVP